MESSSCSFSPKHTYIYAQKKCGQSNFRAGKGKQCDQYLGDQIREILKIQLICICLA